MTLNVPKELAALRRMTIGQLRDRYAEVHGEPTRSYHKEFLVRRITWRLQALDEGDLSERARRRAAENAYRKARREAFSQAIALTQRYGPLAVNTLAKIMADTAAPPNARVTAASTLLRFGREGIELDDLAARLEVLENTAANAEKSGTSRWASGNGFSN